MLFLTSCLSFSLSSCKRRNGRARAHAIRTCRYSNMFEKQNSLYRLKKGAECEVRDLLGAPPADAPGVCQDACAGLARPEDIASWARHMADRPPFHSADPYRGM